MISNEDLLLYLLDDGLTADERARIASALKTDPVLAARHAELAAGLAALPAAIEASVPPAALQRWRTDLDRAARVEADTPRTSRNPLNWKHGLAALGTAFGAALLVTSLKLGVPGIPATSGPDALPTVEAAAADGERYERSLQWHLAQTESQLAGLGGGSVSTEERGRIVDRVMVQNRIYAIAADRANEDRLARVLRSFTPLLETLADRDASPGELNGSMAQLNFELKVMQGRLAASTPASPNLARQVLAL